MKPSDAAVFVVAVDAAPSITLRSQPLPIADINGVLYYALGTHVDAKEPDDLRAWVGDSLGDGLRPVAKPPAPWSEMIGREFVAYTVSGRCDVRVMAIELLDKSSAEEPVMLGRLDGSKCHGKPIVLADQAPTTLPMKAPSPANAKRLKAALVKEPEYAEFRESMPRERGTDRETWMLEIGDKVALAAETASKQTDCGSKAESIVVMYTLHDDHLARVGLIDIGTQPAAALDFAGEPLMYYRAATVDGGMSGYTRYASLRGVDNDASGDVAISYYIGCD